MFAFPVDPRFRVSQKFGANPQYYRRFGFPGHEGIDWAVPVGTPVMACEDGTVIMISLSNRSPYGCYVRIAHKDGYETIYAHLSKALVKYDQYVLKGEVIALSGNTGNSTGPHLHLTVRRIGATAAKLTHYPRDVIDPTPLFDWSVVR